MRDCAAFLVVLAGLCLLGTSGCNPAGKALPRSRDVEARVPERLQNRWPVQRTVDDATSYVPASRTQDWSVVVEEGEGSAGYDRIAVSSSGDVKYRFWDLRADAFLGTGFRTFKDVWREAEFGLSEEQLTQIRHEALSPALWHLKREYHTAVADGFQVRVEVQADGHAKRIYCNNYVPLALHPLIETLRASVAQQGHAIEGAVATTRPGSGGR